ncbi:MAG: hypothetical protein KDJ50_10915 [Alphaproteobacteria bacterium]|nr:hypothetical protein [Alphaproteobacteria bacterium]
MSKNRKLSQQPQMGAQFQAVRQQLQQQAGVLDRADIDKMAKMLGQNFRQRGGRDHSQFDQGELDSRMSMDLVRALQAKGFE